VYVCLCKNEYETEEEARAQQRALEPLMNEGMKGNYSRRFYNAGVSSIKPLAVSTNGRHEMAFPSTF
jgi:hypothetical protein